MRARFPIVRIIDDDAVVARLFAQSRFRSMPRNPIPYTPQRNTHGESQADTTEALTRFHIEWAPGRNKLRTGFGQLHRRVVRHNNDGFSGRHSRVALRFPVLQDIRKLAHIPGRHSPRNRRRCWFKLSSKPTPCRAASCSLGRSASFVSSDERIAAPLVRF